jgi:predicted transcriptional regulator of viral defense system
MVCSLGTQYSCYVTDAKTLGSTAARLVTELAQRDPPVFTLADARHVLGASAQVTSNLLSGLLRQGWIVRVRRGVYEVAPIWATRGSFASDRFAGLSQSLEPPYYVGYRSALERYGWHQHPVVGRLWIAVPQPRRLLRTPRDRVIWVVTKADRFDWGLTQRWLGSARVSVSDPERTFLDCLHLPRHAGGITEVGSAMIRAWSTLDLDRLLAHVERLGNTSVTRRLGALAEAVELEGATRLTQRLPQRRWRGRPVSLDPSLPAGGEVNRRWGVRMNVPADELATLGRT